MSKIGTILKDVAKPFVWIGKKVVDLPKALNKLIVLSADAKQIASDAASEVIAVATDVGDLVKATAEDDGKTLAAFGVFLEDTEHAIASGLTDVAADAAVLQAVATLFGTLKGSNYVDVFAAIAKVIADGKSMTSVVIADFEKLGADVVA